MDRIERTPMNREEDRPDREAEPRARYADLSQPWPRTIRPYVEDIAWLLSELARLRTEAHQMWRCFHCNEAFTDYYVALRHFGSNENAPAACQRGRADGIES